MVKYAGVYRKANDLDSNQRGKFGKYEAFISMGGVWIQFELPGTTSDQLTGWKFHLSVHGDDVERAAEILLRIYDRHDATVFKVTSYEATPSHSSPGQFFSGNVFTLYDMGEKDWSQIVHEIERQFSKTGIRTGLALESSKKAPNCRYTYYRNDGSGDGLYTSYISTAELATLPAEKRYNPLGLPDPFSDMSLTPASDKRASKSKTVPKRGTAIRGKSPQAAVASL
jgi:hypothetical protein